jgi:hypothetical protein
MCSQKAKAAVAQQQYISQLVFLVGSRSVAVRELAAKVIGNVAQVRSRPRPPYQLGRCRLRRYRNILGADTVTCPSGNVPRFAAAEQSAAPGDERGWWHPPQRRRVAPWRCDGGAATGDSAGGGRATPELDGTRAPTCALAATTGGTRTQAAGGPAHDGGGSWLRLQRDEHPERESHMRIPRAIMA